LHFPHNSVDSDLAGIAHIGVVTFFWEGGNLETRISRGIQRRRRKVGWGWAKCWPKSWGREIRGISPVGENLYIPNSGPSLWLFYVLFISLSNQRVYSKIGDFLFGEHRKIFGNRMQWKLERRKKSAVNL